MSYFSPYVDETGLHYPGYNDILEDLILDMQSIYGSGIYLGNDSKDYQMLSAFAEKIYDTYQALEIAYNAHSPVTAIGTGLDYIVAVNGIRRKSATYSTATLTLTGTPGATISNARAADTKGVQWEIPGTVTLDGSGTAQAEAVCAQPGAIEAPANTITLISTPISGWTGVTNAAAAVPGTNVETDSALRGRQVDSVAQPSQTMLSGLKGALSALDDVTRVAVYENDTDDADDNGIPAHSVCCVVEGGDDEDIARTILIRKGIGCGTFGDEEVEVEDDGQTYDICFTHPTPVDVDIRIALTRRSGYAASTASDIKSAIVSYLADFAIGTDLTTSIIWMVAQQVNADARTPTFSITSVTAAKHGQTLGTSDVTIDFDEVARGTAANIVIVES